jgi:hypothetical protein
MDSSQGPAEKAREKVGFPRALPPFATPLFFIPFWGLSAAAAIIGVGYLGTIIFGLWAGDALPTARFFTLHPALRAVSFLEPYVPLWILAASAFGALISWAGSASILDAPLIQKSECGLARFWRLAGLPLLILFFLLMLSGGGWSGLFRPLDQNFMSIASLIPESDAWSYFESALRVDWDQWAARRPLAQAFRDTLVLAAGHSYTTTLLIQAILIAIALFFAARSIARWRGPWVAAAFVALVLIIERPFVFTTLTEPLSAIVILATIPSLVHAFASRSRPHAILAICGVDLALSIRMGAMLLIPAMALWVTICFAKSLRARLVVFAAAVVVFLLVSGAGELFAKLYAPPGAATGGNFADTLCGLSVGGDWSTCTYHRYAEDIRTFEGNQRKIAAFLFEISLKNIFSDPGIFLGALSRDFSVFADGSIPFFLNGYISLNAFSESTAWRLALLLIPGLIWVSATRWNKTEGLFWLGLILATLASAPFLMVSDGWRVLHVTNILLALLLAMGFSAPGWVPQTVAAENPARWHATALGLGAFVVILVIAPACLHWLIRRDLADHPLPPAQEEDVILGGGRKMTGFLVVPDDTPRPLATPALPLSQFKPLLQEIPFAMDPKSRAQLERLALPFAFVWGAPLKAPESSTTFYALPAEVLIRSDVWGWWARDLQGFGDAAQSMWVLSSRAVDPVP